MHADEEQNMPAEKPCAHVWTPHELKYLSQVIAPETLSRRAQPKRQGGRTPKRTDDSLLPETRREETAERHAPEASMA